MPTEGFWILAICQSFYKHVAHLAHLIIPISLSDGYYKFYFRHKDNKVQIISMSLSDRYYKFYFRSKDDEAQRVKVL